MSKEFEEELFAPSGGGLGWGLVCDELPETSLVDPHGRRSVPYAGNRVGVRYRVSDAVLQPAAAGRLLRAAPDIGPGRADPILGAPALAGLPAVRLEVLVIRTRAIDFVFCPQITFGDEVARSGIAARILDDLGQGVLEPAAPVRPLDLPHHPQRGAQFSTQTQNRTAAGDR